MLQLTKHVGGQELVILRQLGGPHISSHILPLLNGDWSSQSSSALGNLSNRVSSELIQFLDESAASLPMDNKPKVHKYGLDFRYQELGFHECIIEIEQILAKIGTTVLRTIITRCHQVIRPASHRWVLRPQWWPDDIEHQSNCSHNMTGECSALSTIRILNTRTDLIRLFWCMYWSESTDVVARLRQKALIGRLDKVVEAGAQHYSNGNLKTLLHREVRMHLLIYTMRKLETLQGSQSEYCALALRL